MKHLYKISMCLLLPPFILASLSLTAQTNSNRSAFNPYWEINLNAGVTQFFGDIWNGNISPGKNEINTWRYAEGITIGKQFNPVIGLRTQAIMGELTGENQISDVNFITDYYEFNLHSTFNLSNLLNRKRTDRKINFYAMLGYGLTNYKTTKYSISNLSTLAQKGHGEGNGLNGMVMESNILGGLGINIQFGKNLGLTVETGNRFMLTDGIDIVDNNRKTDIYNYTAVGLQYRFGQSRQKLPAPLQEVDLKEVKQEVIRDNTDSLNVQNQDRKIVEQPKTVKPEKELEIKEAPYKEPVGEKKPEPETSSRTMSYDPQYRVQIRACFNCQLTKEVLGQLYKLEPESIKEDKFGTYYIYTYGSFSNYQDAKDLRDKLKRENMIADAFVVAFSKGVRLKKLPEQK